MLSYFKDIIGPFQEINGPIKEVLTEGHFQLYKEEEEYKILPQMQ